MPTIIDAPIAAVTVYPRHARVTRKGRADLGSGDRFVVSRLPLGLAPESVRVSGSGPATVVGVDLTPEVHAQSADPVLEELLERERAARQRLDEVVDAETVQNTRSTLLDSLARRSGSAFAKALSTGETAPDRVAEVGDALAEQLAQVLARRRELTEQHTRLAEELAAASRAVEQRGAEQGPDRNAVTIELAADEGAGEAEVELELSYVVSEAGWDSGYDVRLRDDTLTLTWYGLITQHTGEDWPECELALSTARPSATLSIPELAPWFLDRERKAGAVREMAAGGLEAYAPPPGAAAAQGYELAASTAEVRHGIAAATYRPRRPVAVPTDGGAHRTTITELELATRLDHVTAPSRDEHAYLRAVATNTSEHTLRPGNASVFHGTEFIGTTRLEPWAPGEEVELALGIDERIRVERELVRRSAGKAGLPGLPGARRRDAEYRTTVHNHGPRQATVTVLDQVPVSRDEAITVRDVRTSPEPAERTDLGELSWRLDLPPGGSAELSLSFRVDVGKGVELTGWRE
ncbi:DUF4139 domain-containing protein [Amycolatopsis cihanbeyliensis]|uniref:Uncharacterized protein (TIGR02231 family) n=1 Tax=Amycolatopsis cihanbeyliensis TaxID=1128664 RepID=A0A542DFZ8_AMYCI|nr:DUF4139 domain-containing protein [Amycolatopsis cihanbeyliensis]TQJ01961.1 uncharacterized protein (TIGR02231 family) [Amycolatopsis cihanbeyliensis]